MSFSLFFFLFFFLSFHIESKNLNISYFTESREKDATELRDDRYKEEEVNCRKQEAQTAP